MDLKGKTAVVSGGTSGIGRATALMLAGRGAEVFIVGQNAERGAETEAALKAASSGKGAFIRADLSLVADAKRAVFEIGGKTQKVDALVQSAGAIVFEASTTSEGLDKLFVTNFLHKVVLAEGLKPMLAKAQGRMVFVAADVADKMEPDWPNFEGARVYGSVPVIPKLQAATQCLVQDWAAKWKADGIEVTAIHPGLVGTGIFRNFKGGWKMAQWLMSLFFVPVEMPATLLSWLAFSPEAKGFSGYFFPSVKNYTKRRQLKRSAQALERVNKVVQGLLKT